MAPPPPLEVTVIRGRRLLPALRAVGLAVHPVSTVEAALAAATHDRERAIVVHASALPARRAQETIARIRAARPLTDVVLWAPSADPEVVRQALLGGARDAVLSPEPQDLAERVRDVVASQVFLPQVQSLGAARKRGAFEGMISRSAQMWDLFDLSVRVAPTGATILVLGETGTGKELLARAIHRRSERSGRFVAVNCAALPEGLVDAELFGHERGTFTGATRAKQGLFRHAEGGTLFLDEIGDVPLPAQFSLLRALQEGRIRPVGAHEEVPVDVRVIAATSVPLEDAVARGAFREDLLYRLDVIRMVVPPLRERQGDLAYLFGRFAKRFAASYKLPRPKVGEDFLDALLAHPWQGNVRQLENFTERLVLTHVGEVLTARHFEELTRPFSNPGRHDAPTARRPSDTGRPSPAGAPNRRRGPAPPAPSPAHDPLGVLEVDLEVPLAEALEALSARFEETYLRRALEEARGKVGEASRRAGISRRTMSRKMLTYGLDKADFRRP